MRKDAKIEWQLIETAPLDGTEVLVCRNYGNVTSYSVAAFNGKEWRDCGDIGWAGMYGGDGDNHPTHWMPLPPPPESIS